MHEFISIMSHMFLTINRWTT